MSAENQSRIPDVRITYHADGSATVNDVPVTAESGQSAESAESGSDAGSSSEPDGSTN